MGGPFIAFAFDVWLHDMGRGIKLAEAGWLGGCMLITSVNGFLELMSVFFSPFK